MIESTKNSTDTALWLDDQPVSTAEVMAVLRKERKLPELIRNLVLDRALSKVKVSPDREAEILNDFRQKQQIESDEAFADFLKKNHLTEQLLQENLCRPHRVVQFREERWGPRANSLYLKHKDRYDRINYRRLQSANADVMQEVFFRLKDKEDTWETMARQFSSGTTNIDPHQKSIPAAQIEAPLLAALLESGPGIIIRPVKLDSNTVVVAELESIEASYFDEKLRRLILNQEFENWLREECNKMFNKLQIPA